MVRSLLPGSPIVAAALSAGPCRPDAPAPAPAAPPDDAAVAAAKAHETPDATAPGATGARDGTSDSGTGDAAAAYEGRTPVRARSIGNTSVVYRLVLDDGRKAAYKPRSKRGKGRYKGEIAAHRLARALGLDNVPLALPFRVRASALRAAVAGGTDGGTAARSTPRRPPSSTKRCSPNPTASSAGRCSVDRRALLPSLEKADERARWEPWIFGDAPLPEASKALAAELSTVIAFDTLTANWDRWSGGNIGRGAPSGPLLYIDNDGAFFEPPNAALFARQKAQLARVTRFSRAFVEKLRALDDDALSAAVGEEIPGEPLLTDSVLRGVSQRRALVLEAIDAKIRERGESAALAL